MHAGHLPGYPASHGCVRLPERNAIAFFNALEVGSPVTVFGSTPAAGRSRRQPDFWQRQRPAPSEDEEFLDPVDDRVYAPPLRWRQFDAAVFAAGRAGEAYASIILLRDREGDVVDLRHGERIEHVDRAAVFRLFVADDRDHGRRFRCVARFVSAASACLAACGRSLLCGVSNGSSLRLTSPISEMVMICSSTKSVELDVSAVPGQLRVELVLHFHRAGHDHEEEHDDEDDVDHRRDLKAERCLRRGLSSRRIVSPCYGGKGDVADARFRAGVHRLRDVHRRARRDRRG